MSVPLLALQPFPPSRMAAIGTSTMLAAPLRHAPPHRALGPAPHHAVAAAVPRRGACRCRAAEEMFEMFSDDEEEYVPDTHVRLFLDSAAVAEWEKWGATGMFFGFTTNPTILKRDGVQCTLPSLKNLAAAAFRSGAQELQLQAWGATAREMAAIGRDLYGIDDRVVVKLPVTFAGIQAAKVLTDDAVPFTLTGIYAAHQVVTAIAAGATYAAPYLGRMNDAGKDGMREIVKMQDIISQDQDEEYGMRLLVASLRSPQEIADLAADGCNTFTISPAVAQAMFEEQLTNEAAEVFQQHALEMGAT